MHATLILVNNDPRDASDAGSRCGDASTGATKEETMNINKVVRFRYAFAMALLSISVAAAARAGPDEHPAQVAQPTTAEEAPMKFQVPEVLKEEHAQLHAELEPLTQAGGETGKAAQAVAEVLHVHFVKEEKYALPPLALLLPLANGELSPDMAAVLPLTEELKRNMPQMLVEHGELHKALLQLAAAGKAEHKPEAERFAEELMHHAQMEEQVMYPAAMLVGEYLKLRLPAGHEPGAMPTHEHGN